MLHHIREVNITLDKMLNFSFCWFFPHVCKCQCSEDRYYISIMLWTESISSNFNKFDLVQQMIFPKIYLIYTRIFVCNGMSVSIKCMSLLIWLTLCATQKQGLYFHMFRHVHIVLYLFLEGNKEILTARFITLSYYIAN